MEESQSVSIPEFVIQEAKQKAFEIEVKSLKQFEREKTSIIEFEQEKIFKQYEEKLKQQEMDYRIKRSTSINFSRLQKMEARNQAMMKVFSDAQYKIYQRIRNDTQFYKNLLVNLIAQGLIKLFENRVKIRCLQKDIKIVEQCIPDAVKMFKELVKRELNQDFQINLTVDKDKYLLERVLDDNSNQKVESYDLETGAKEVVQKNEEDRKCFGGIVLCNDEGNIICKNTLDVRVQLSFEDSLPDLRALLFPEKK